MAEIKCYTFDNATGILTKVGIIDDFTSFSFKRGYTNVGEWQLVLDGNSVNASRIKGMQIISVSDGVAGLVSKCEESNTDNQHTITYTGVELKGIAAQRIIIPPAGAAYQEYTNQAPEYVIAQLITQQIINPSDTSRRIAGTLAAYTSDAEHINFSGRFDNVDDAIQTIANTYHIKWYADIQDDAIVWHISYGLDRSISQSENSRMIVSNTLDSFGNSTVNIINQLPNVALVAGQGEGVGRATTIVGSGTALNRSEVYIDARDIADSSQLLARGTEALAGYGDALTYSATFAESFIKMYRNPFDLGDIGTIIDDRLPNGSIDFRITEITEVYEGDILRLDVTFGYDRQGLVETIKRTAGNTQSLINLESSSNLALLAYPIGSIYMSVNSTSPATLFGGTWIAFGTGRTLVGLDTSQTEFNTVEKTGGHKKMQTHSHGVDINTGGQSANHTHGIYLNTSGQSANHTHQVPRQGYVGSGSGNGASLAWDFSSGSNDIAQTYGTSGNHAHTLSGDTYGASAGHSHNVNGNTANIGTGDSENLQPYITCYMWKRTA
jgi:hypothetical protein